MKCKICGKIFNPVTKEPQRKGKTYGQRFLEAKEALGDADYYHILSNFGFANASKVTKVKVDEVLKALESITETIEVFDEN